MLQWLFGKKKQEGPPKPQKPKAEQQAQDKWKFDFLVQFLCGPLWKTSILDFVDYHCVVFDNQQQNKFQYTTIHNKFKELVANLFDGMIQQIGLDEQKLAELLQKGFQGKHKKIFNQLLLADDYLRFKQLMVNRNKTLEAQAIKALKQSSQPNEVEHKKQKKRVNIEKDVLLQSKRAEEQRLKKIQYEEQEQLRKVLEMSRIQAEEKEMIKQLQIKAAEQQLRKSKQPVEDIPKKQPVKEVKLQQKKQIKREIKEEVSYKPQIIEEQPSISANQNQKQKSKLSSLEPLPPVRSRKTEISPIIQKPKIVEQQQRQVEESKPVPIIQKQQKAQGESQQQRKRRLMQQRQKIRKKKQQERKKQAADEQLRATSNPVQTIVLQQQGINEIHMEMQQDKKQKVNKEEIQRRRALMKKIKNRIVDDF